MDDNTSLRKQQCDEAYNPMMAPKRLMDAYGLIQPCPAAPAVDVRPGGWN